MSQEAALFKLLRRGPLGSSELCRKLGISQPTFSRLAARCGPALLRHGEARATRYMLARAEQNPVALYRVNPAGQLEQLATLQACHGGWFCSSNTGQFWLDALPWWLPDRQLPAPWWRNPVPAGLADDAWLGWLQQPDTCSGQVIVGIDNRSFWLNTFAGESDHWQWQADQAVDARRHGLLQAAQLAQELLACHGLPALAGHIRDAGSIRTLQQSRPDCTAGHGRLGVVTLATLAGLPAGSCWVQLAKALQPKLPTDVLAMLARQYALAQLIGDLRPPGTLVLHYTHPLAADFRAAPMPLCWPAALLAQADGHVPESLPAFTLPAGPDVAVWLAMLPLAREYWAKLAHAKAAGSDLCRIAMQQWDWLDTIEAQLARVVA